MLALVAVENRHEAEEIPNSTIEGDATDDGNTTFVAVRKLEAFAHDDDVIHLIYKQNTEYDQFDVRSAVRVSLGTLEEDELTELDLAEASPDD